MPMAIASIMLLAILASLFVSLTVSETLVSSIDYQTPSSLTCQVEEAKLQVRRLEAILGERIAEIDAKIQHFRICEKKIEELTAEIDLVKTAVSSSEHDYFRANLKISALEEEVRLLFAASRKSNFDIHALEYKALDAEVKLKEIASKVEEMTEIVSEQWIQIQQLEQAVHMAEVRTSEIRKELWKRCPFVKFCINLFNDCLNTLKRVLGSCVPRDGHVLVFCRSQALRTFGAAKHYHHQGFIKHAMQSNEFTVALAHEEVVFFVASALVAFPIMSVCMLLSLQFSSWK